MENNSNKPILILGSFGRGNIGDDIFLAAAEDLFNGRMIYINSSKRALLPESLSATVNIIPTDTFHNIRQKASLLSRLDSIIYCGGDLWVDLEGDKFPRKSLYKMVILNVVCKLLGKKIYYIGCGVGEISGYSLLLARISAKLSKKIVLRDHRSAKLLGLGNGLILPDLAINLTFRDTKATKERDGKRINIGISLLYYLPNKKLNFHRLMNAISELISSLDHTVYNIVLLPMYINDGDSNDDLWVSNLIKGSVPNTNIKILRTRDITEYLKAISDLNIVIGTRLHANILASFSGIPCIGIAYRPKVREFFKENGIEEYCLELEDIRMLKDKVIKVLKNIREVTTKFEEISKLNLDYRSNYKEIADSINA